VPNNRFALTRILVSATIETFRQRVPKLFCIH